MKIDDRLKRIIFKKLAKDLSYVEIIPYEDSIWFIDRDKKYWYFQFEDNGTLWWRYDFFEQFFQAFSLERVDYEPLIKEWVEQVLKRKVTTSSAHTPSQLESVEQVLKRKVTISIPSAWLFGMKVEDVLNYEVITTATRRLSDTATVEQVLNSN
jgi:hypothetical protein